MNLILLQPSELRAGGVVRLSAGRAEHLRAVLRVSPGVTVRVGLIDGPLGVGTVTSVSAEAVELRCAFEERPPGRPPVDLLLALPRPKVMRRLWANLAAIGVGQILLTNAEKVERDYFGSHALREEAYRGHLLEGLQQAKDTRLPTVSIHKRFRVLVEDDLDKLCPDARRIVAHPGPSGAAGPSVSGVLSGTRPGERVLVAVGPEGGWNTFELGLLEAHGFSEVSMGPRTLNTQTACIAILALVHDALRQHAG